MAKLGQASNGAWSHNETWPRADGQVVGDRNRRRQASHQIKDYVAKLGRKRTRPSNDAESNKDTWLRTDGQIVGDDLGSLFGACRAAPAHPALRFRIW